jgi:hypothetical protein
MRWGAHTEHAHGAIMKIVMCKQGGLMEDPEWHWEQIGEGEGETLEEVCDNIASKDPSFAAHYSKKHGISFWGWELALFNGIDRPVAPEGWEWKLVRK